MRRPGAHLTARAWRRVVQASALPGYGYRYRRWVLDSLRYIGVQDLATGGDHIPELSDVYVDVALVSRAPHQVPGNPLSRAAGDSSERHSISELLDTRSRVVLALVGQPGSGKSTLLAYAARRSAQTAVRGRMGRRRVPILLALREHTESIVADPAISLPDVVRGAVGGGPGKEPGGWWERQLRRGRCLVLLDGLDEVASTDDRLAVADWVRAGADVVPLTCGFSNHSRVKRAAQLPSQDPVLGDRRDRSAGRGSSRDAVRRPPGRSRGRCSRWLRLL